MTLVGSKVLLPLCVCVCVCVCVCMCVCALSHVRFFVAPWTVVCPAPLSMEFSRQEYWRGLPFPFPSPSFCIWWTHGGYLCFPKAKWLVNSVSTWVGLKALSPESTLVFLVPENLRIWQKVNFSLHHNFLRKLVASSIHEWLPHKYLFYTPSGSGHNRYPAFDSMKYFVLHISDRGVTQIGGHNVTYFEGAKWFGQRFHNSKVSFGWAGHDAPVLPHWETLK